MSAISPQLVFLALGGSIAPPLPPLTILFLGSRRPLPNATALALGYFATCVVVGIAGLTLFEGAESTTSVVGRVIGVTAGVLLIVVGLRNLLSAPDPDAQPPGWMESVKSMSPPREFGVALFPPVPHRASDLLGSLRRWMEKHSRTVSVVLCFVFGAFFCLEASWDRELMRTPSKPELETLAETTPRGLRVAA